MLTKTLSGTKVAIQKKKVLTVSQAQLKAIQDTRQARSNFEWNLCFFVERSPITKTKDFKVSTDKFCITFEKKRCGLKASTDEFGIAIEKKAMDLNDFNLLSRVEDFSKLCAIGVQYLIGCHSN